MVDYIQLSIEDLLLDQDNPRIGSVDSQSEALEAIVNLNESHFRTLMKSIKENGLDPGDNLYIIDEENGDDFVVLDGNRRLSALLVLSNPDILDGTAVSPAIKKSLLKISNKFNRSIVDPIRCVKFDHRGDADEWIHRRHTGGANGEGRINWGPLEIQRFQDDQTILDILDFVGRNADYSDEEWSSTRSAIESRKSSNVDRILQSAPGRKHIGISVLETNHSRVPMLKSDPEWALKVLTRIIEDVRDDVINSRIYNKASEIQEYFDELPIDLQPKDGDFTPRAFREINLKNITGDESLSDPSKDTSTEKKDQIDGKPNKKQKTERKLKGVPKDRKTLAPRRHHFNIPSSPKGEKLLREAGLLDADKFTIAAAFVLRGLLELAINDYFELHNLTKDDENSSAGRGDKLSRKAQKVVEHIVSQDPLKKNDMNGFRRQIINNNSLVSIQSLHGFVHGKFQIPTAEALRSGWDCSIPIFIATYGSVK